MNNYYKLFIVGLEHSGRSEFLKVISDFPPISIEKKIVTTERMMPLDYGRAVIGNFFFYLYSPSENIKDEILKEMQDSFSEEMSATIILSSFKHLDYAKLKAMISTITEKSSLYIVVFCADFAEDVIDISEMGKKAWLTNEAPLLSCVISEKESIKNLLLEIGQAVEHFNIKTS